jgi:hypothetical protein
MILKGILGRIKLLNQTITKYSIFPSADFRSTNKIGRMRFKIGKTQSMVATAINFFLSNILLTTNILIVAAAKIFTNVHSG